MDYRTPWMNSERRSRGCFFYGCLTLVLVFLGLVVGTYFGTRYAVKKLVATYTEAAPAEVPSIGLTDADVARRADELRTQFQRGGADQIALEATDLNVLLRQNPQAMKVLSNRIHFALETNLVKATVSLPLDEFKPWQQATTRLLAPSLKNRYLNASVYFAPVFTNAELQIELKDVRVHGMSLPVEFTSKLSLNEATRDANSNPAVRQVLDRVEGVAIENGQLILRFKKP